LECLYTFLNREIAMLLADPLNEAAALEYISHRRPYICEQQFDILLFQLGLQVIQHLNAVNVKPGARFEIDEHGPGRGLDRA
jgi:hypothetical protein